MLHTYDPAGEPPAGRAGHEAGLRAPDRHCGGANQPYTPDTSIWGQGIERFGIYIDIYFV